MLNHTTWRPTRIFISTLPSQQQCSVNSSVHVWVHRCVCVIWPRLRHEEQFKVLNTLRLSPMLLTESAKLGNKVYKTATFTTNHLKDTHAHRCGEDLQWSTLAALWLTPDSFNNTCWQKTSGTLKVTECSNWIECKILFFLTLSCLILVHRTAYEVCEWLCSRN